MGSITVRRLDDDVVVKLKSRAARNGWSIEEEARVVLRRSVLVAVDERPSIGRMLFDASRPGIELPDVRDRAPARYAVFKD